MSVARCLKLFLAIVIPAALMSACSTTQSGTALRRFEFKQPHMGTLFTITLYTADEAKAREASDAAFAKIAALERMMTDYDPDSELMHFAENPQASLFG